MRGTQRGTNRGIRFAGPPKLRMSCTRGWQKGLLIAYGAMKACTSSLDRPCPPWKLIWKKAGKLIWQAHLASSFKIFQVSQRAILVIMQGEHQRGVVLSALLRTLSCLRNTKLSFEACMTKLQPLTFHRHSLLSRYLRCSSPKDYRLTCNLDVLMGEVMCHELFATT